MKTLALVLLCCSAAAAQAQDANIEEVNHSPVAAKFASHGTIRMHLCPGGIELVGSDKPEILVSYEPRHGHDIEVHVQTAGGRAEVDVSGCPNNNFRMTIEIPKASDLFVRMMAGQLTVDGIRGDKDVELHFGQLTMDVGDPDQIAHIEGSVNSGDLHASAFGIAKGGLFRSFEQNGNGVYRVRAHVGAGQLNLR